MDAVLAAAVSILFHGLAYAMVLYLISAGLSVTMGLMGFANLAHGVFAMAGGYVTVKLMNDLGVPFALGSALAALGGGIGAEILAINPHYAIEHLIYFLIVVAVGGLGSLRGSFFAALLLGVGDTACKYLVPELGAFFVYVAVMAVLLWRPAGLFGRAA